MLTKETFRLEVHPGAHALREHAVWASYTEPSDASYIATWGIDPAWLERSLRSFEGFDEGHTHPMFPVLDLTVVGELGDLVVAADFVLANGAELFGFLVSTHAFGLFVEDTEEVFNRNLPSWAAESARRVDQRLGGPAFPLSWRARAACAEAGISGTVDPWW